MAAGSPTQGLVAQLTVYQDELRGQVAALQSEIDGISAALAALGARKPKAKKAGRRPGRPAKRKVKKMVRPGPRAAVARRGPRPEGARMADYIAKVLGAAGGAMSLKDITVGIVKAGYKTSSRNLGNQVSMTLNQMKKRKQVRKTGRGMYARGA